VKVYTNAERATLELNGRPIGSARAANRIVLWPDVPLEPGRNTLVVRTDAGATDAVVWEGRP
jgi:beta-galactosidase